MRKVTLIISVFLNLFLIYFFVFRGNVAKNKKDNRIVINLTKNNADFALTEMREFLESVSAIQEGITTNNPTLIINAGKKSGGSVIAHAPKGMMASLPMGFKKLGFSVHGLFDEIAEDASNSFSKPNTEKKLNTLLKKCIACHRTYKINTK